MSENSDFMELSKVALREQGWGHYHQLQVIQCSDGTRTLASDIRVHLSIELDKQRQQREQQERDEAIEW